MKNFLALIILLAAVWPQSFCCCSFAEMVQPEVPSCHAPAAVSLSDTLLQSCTCSSANPQNMVIPAALETPQPVLSAMPIPPSFLKFKAEMQQVAYPLQHKQQIGFSPPPSPALLSCFLI